MIIFELGPYLKAALGFGRPKHFGDAVHFEDFILILAFFHMPDTILEVKFD